MPLSCDCYGGCWAVHSKQWPVIIGSTAKSLWARAVKKLPYGTYVLISDKELRIETEALKNELLKIGS